MMDNNPGAVWIERATDLSANIALGDRCKLERGDLWCEIARDASRDVAAEIAAEADVSASNFRAELWVSTSWPPESRTWPLSWSHYRATAHKSLDADARAALMDRAMTEGLGERELARAAREARAAGGAGLSDVPHDPADPADYDSWQGYAVARIVESGTMSESRAVALVADVARYRGEWRATSADTPDVARVRAALPDPDVLESIAHSLDPRTVAAIALHAAARDVREVLSWLE